MRELALYRTIEKHSEAYLNEKSSKFYAYSYHVKSEEEVAIFLKGLRNQFPDANHHCSAYVLGAEKAQQKASDDGEPSGSAGKPILHAILSMNLSDVLVIVVRYFGGKQLGVRGLIDIYHQAALDVLQRSTVVERPLTQPVNFHYRYEQEPFIQRIWKKFNLKPSNHLPDLTGIHVHVFVPIPIVDQFLKDLNTITNEVEIGAVR